MLYNAPYDMIIETSMEGGEIAGWINLQSFSSLKIYHVPKTVFLTQFDFFSEEGEL